MPVDELCSADHVKNAVDRCSLKMKINFSSVPSHCRQSNYHWVYFSCTWNSWVHSKISNSTSSPQIDLFRSVLLCSLEHHDTLRWSFPSARAQSRISIYSMFYLSLSYLIQLNCHNGPFTVNRVWFQAANHSIHLGLNPAITVKLNQMWRGWLSDLFWRFFSPNGQNAIVTAVKEP